MGAAVLPVTALVYPIYLGLGFQIGLMFSALLSVALVLLWPVPETDKEERSPISNRLRLDLDTLGLDSPILDAHTGRNRPSHTAEKPGSWCQPVTPESSEQLVERAKSSGPRKFSQKWSPGMQRHKSTFSEKWSTPSPPPTGPLTRRRTIPETSPPTVSASASSSRVRSTPAGTKEPAVASPRNRSYNLAAFASDQSATQRPAQLAARRRSGQCPRPQAESSHRLHPQRGLAAGGPLTQPGSQPIAAPPQAAESEPIRARDRSPASSPPPMATRHLPATPGSRPIRSKPSSADVSPPSPIGSSRSPPGDRAKGHTTNSAAKPGARPIAAKNAAAASMSARPEPIARQITSVSGDGASPTESRPRPIKRNHLARRGATTVAEVSCSNRSSSSPAEATKQLKASALGGFPEPAHRPAKDPADSARWSEKFDAEPKTGGCREADALEVARQRSQRWWACLDAQQRAVELEWQRTLSPEQFRVLRQKQTEEVNKGAYTVFNEQGAFKCAACELLLYTSEHKFSKQDSVHGWAAFFDNVPGHVLYEENSKMPELTCARCGGHLGHAFYSKRYPGDKHQRHCINSTSLSFSPADAAGV